MNGYHIRKTKYVRLELVGLVEHELCQSGIIDKVFDLSKEDEVISFDETKDYSKTIKVVIKRDGRYISYLSKIETI